MNRLGILLLQLPFCLVASALDIDDGVQQRNLLLEDFTGIHCGYCPQAHVIMHNLEYYHGNAVLPIAVHSGYYANPYRGEPDYRTVAGDAVTTALGLMDEGRPIGALNRRLMDNGIYGIGRGYWGYIFKQIHAEESPVNLAAEAVYDNDTRMVHLAVAGYSRYEEQKDCYLSVAVVQDNIQGPQNGAGVGDEYIHQDILRDYLTAPSGDAISLSPLSRFDKEFDFELPERYYASEDDETGVAVVPHDIRFIIFLTENEYTDVINVIGCRPQLQNYPTTPAATLKDPILAPGSKYGYQFFELQLCNRYNETVSTADFRINLNGEVEEYRWEGELAPYESKIIKVPYSQTISEDDNDYSVTLHAVNGEEIEESSLSGSFYQPGHSTPNVKIVITTDEYADEDTFIIYDAEGNKVAELGPYEAGVAATYTEEVSLEAGKTYCFEIRDYCVDGMYKGSYKVYSGDGALIEQNYDMADVGAMCFFTTDKASSVRTVAVNSAEVRYSDGMVAINGAEGAVATLYTASGAEVSRFAVSSDRFEKNLGVGAGLYLLTVKSEGVKGCYKIIVK